MEPKRYPHGAKMVPTWSNTGTKKNNDAAYAVHAAYAVTAVYLPQPTVNNNQQTTHSAQQVRVCSYRAFFINRASRSFWQYRFTKSFFFALVFRVVFERVFGSILSPQVLPASTPVVQQVHFLANVCDVFPDIAKKSSKEGFCARFGTPFTHANLSLT